MSENELIPSTWNDAVSGGPDSTAYDEARKLGALALVEENPDMSGAEAAVRSDRSLFRKVLDFLVGIGELGVKDVIHKWIDRAHAAAVAFTERKLPVAVKAGCVWIGRVVGSVFGPAGAVAGSAFGTWLAGILNEDVEKLARAGLEKLRQYAHSLWEGLKARLIEKSREFRQGIVARATSVLS